MQTNTLLPDAEHLRLECLRWDGSQATMLVSSSSATAACPKCGQSSQRVHSHYRRQLQDLPWQGIAIRVEWHSRRFFCDNGCCARRIFTERLPKLEEALRVYRDSGNKKNRTCTRKLFACPDAIGPSGPCLRKGIRRRTRGPA